MNDAFICDAIRTPIGRYGGALKDVRADDLGAERSIRVARAGRSAHARLAHYDPRVNPNGGAIARGHPLGASGARLITTALYQLKRINGRFALCTMCIGVGQGIALVIERLE
jgi:acetyl-CoA acetyltransferase